MTYSRRIAYFWMPLLAALTCLTVSGNAQSLAERVEALRKEMNVPALGAAHIKDGTVIETTATGLRHWKKDAPVTEQDLWHLGSNTKAMTATLIGVLVEDGLLSFESTLAELFPEEAASFHQDFKAVTVAQLLSHTSGLPANADIAFRLRMSASDAPLPDQRLMLLRDVLGRAPLSKPGSTYLYSNVGYVLAGAVAEKLTGKSWEIAIEERVFTPLGITQFGFGAPGTSDEALDQPRGHRGEPPARFAMPTGPTGDNPAFMGPAGTAHMSLKDWAKFAIEHIKGPSGEGKLLTADTYKRLHARVLGDYALGWGLGQIEEGSVIAHFGSNTYWMAGIFLLPEKGAGALVVTNDGRMSTMAPMRDFGMSLLREAAHNSHN